MPLLPYLNKRAKDDVRPKQDQEDLENRYMHAEEKPQPPGDGSDSQHRIEAAHLKAIQAPDKVRAQQGQADPYEPGSMVVAIQR